MDKRAALDVLYYKSRIKCLADQKGQISEKKYFFQEYLIKPSIIIIIF